MGDRARRDAHLQPGPVVVVTNLAVLVKDDDDRPFRLESVHPGVEPAVERTGFALDVPAEVPATPEPTPEQLCLLRERIDPRGTVKFDFLPGKERLGYLKEILDAEWQQAAALVSQPSRS